MGFLTDAVDYVTGELTTAGLTNVTADIRNLNTPGVLVDPPTIASISPGAGAATLVFQIIVVAPPPAAGPAVRNILDRADTIMQITNLNVTGGTPSAITVGQTELPAYTLTSTIPFRR